MPTIQKHFSINQNQLKLIACISMFIDHLTKALHVTGAGYTVLRLIVGRLAFPIFSFTLIEGFFYTKKRSRYLLRLLFLALISEVPFDLVSSGQIWDISHQNTLFTLALGLLMLWGMDTIASIASLSVTLGALLQMGIFASIGLIAWLLHTDYNILGIACIASMYILQIRLRTSADSPDRRITRNTTAAFFGCVMLNLHQFDEPAAFLALLPITAYNGQPGSKKYRQAFYLFYPLHLALLAVIAKI